MNMDVAWRGVWLVVAVPASGCGPMNVGVAWGRGWLVVANPMDCMTGYP